MNKIKNIDINKLFIIIASILGITFSILFPLYQTPDELTHIDMIYGERNIKASFLEINEGYSGTENIMNNENQKVNLKEYFDFTKNEIFESADYDKSFLTSNKKDKQHEKELIRNYRKNIHHPKKQLSSEIWIFRV